MREEAFEPCYTPWFKDTLLSYCLVAQGMKSFYIKRFGQWF